MPQILTGETYTLRTVYGNMDCLVTGSCGENEDAYYCVVCINPLGEQISTFVAPQQKFYLKKKEILKYSRISIKTYRRLAGGRIEFSLKRRGSAFIITQLDDAPKHLIEMVVMDNPNPKKRKDF